MLKQFFVLLVLIASLSVNSYAQDEESKHPIDIANDACQEKDPSTRGINRCLSEAEDLWDRELNSVYRELMQTLPPNERQSLKASQKEWMRFRDKEFDTIYTFYSPMVGTMYSSLLLSDRLDIVRTRALRLEEYLRLYKER